MAPSRPMVDSDVTGRMPGRTGVSTPRSRRSATRPSYSDGLEEELGDPEVGQLELGRQEVTVARQVGRAGVAGRVGRHADGEAADGAGQLHQLRREGELTGAGARVLGRVATERHQVLHAGLAQGDEDVGQLQAGVGHADEVGHRVELGRVQHARDEVEGALARLGAAPVGHRDERRLQRLQLADGAGEGGQLLVVLGREELERVRRAGLQQLRDAGHATDLPAHPPPTRP